jgi:hypothetical protein
MVDLAMAAILDEATAIGWAKAEHHPPLPAGER